MKYPLILLILAMCFTACKKDSDELDANDTSLTAHWMQNLLIKHVDKKVTLKDICLPRAHDAGVYVLNNCTAGNACNTKTQDQSMYNMLKAGVRVFDVRPTIIDGEYWTYHRTNCGGLGCEGETMQVFLQDTKRYIDEHNELVIFEMNNLCNTGSQDPGLMALINQELAGRIYKLESPLGQDFVDTDLKEIIPAYNNGGIVVLIWDGVNTASANPTEGIFPKSFIPYSGTYANNPDIETVMNDQIQKFNAFDPTGNTLFRFSYTFTLSTGLAVACVSNPEEATSIEDISVVGRDQMPARIDAWIVDGTFTKTKIPNILSVDFANTSVTMQCIKLAELSLE